METANREARITLRPRGSPCTRADVDDDDDDDNVAQPSASLGGRGPLAAGLGAAAEMPLHSDCGAATVYKAL